MIKESEILKIKSIYDEGYIYSMEHADDLLNFKSEFDKEWEKQLKKEKKERETQRKRNKLKK